MRTAGSPLFLTNLLDWWVEQQLIRPDTGHWELAVDPGQLASSTPASIVSLIANEIERLPPFERSLLETASVAGFEHQWTLTEACVERIVAHSQGPMRSAAGITSERSADDCAAATPCVVHIRLDLD
jgi:hypothetical protein